MIDKLIPLIYILAALIWLTYHNLGIDKLFVSSQVLQRDIFSVYNDLSLINLERIKDAKTIQ